MADDPVVFISYRRSDASGDAGRLYDSLRRRFGRENVFMDVDSVQPGADWVDAINESVAACDVMLAVIGPDWVSVKDDGGNRRLEDEGDHVRLEIEAALNADKPVIPLLVEDADTPKRGQLPTSLQPLLRHQGYRLSHQTYGADIQGLVRALRHLKRDMEPEPTKPVAAKPAVAAAVPPPTAAAPAAPTVAPKPQPTPTSAPVPPPAAPRPAAPQPAPVVPPAASAPPIAPPPPEWTVYAAPMSAPAAARPVPSAGAPPTRNRNLIFAAVGGLGLLVVLGGLWAFGAFSPKPFPPPSTQSPHASGGIAPPSLPTPVPQTFGPPSPLSTPPGGVVGAANVTIGVDLPLSGSQTSDTQPIANAVQLAVEQFNAAHPGIHAVSVAMDNAVGGITNAEQGVTNMTSFVNDPTVLGVVGPYNSTIARAEIPVTNEAGLAQCSPTNAGTDLTRDGSDKYRFQEQDTRNYFRVAPPDSVQGTAMASFDLRSLGRNAAYVMHDSDPESVAEAAAFVAEFELLGGQVTDSVVAATDSGALLNQIQSADQLGSNVVFSSVSDVSALASAREALLTEGMYDVPFTVTDSVFSDDFLSIVGGTDSNNVYATSGVPFQSSTSTFDTDYQLRFGSAAGVFSAAGYACAQVLLQAIGDTAEAGSDAGLWRDTVRGYILDNPLPHTYDTPLGIISFDSNGDITQPLITYYQTDPTMNEGAGGWAFVRQDAIEP